MSNVQFPYPRGNASPSATSAYTGRSTSSYRLKRALKTYGPPFLGLVLLIWLLVYLFSSPTSPTKPPPGTPPVVIVTTIDPHLSDKHKDAIRENRQYYASRHGYATFFPNTTDYDLMAKTPRSWSTVPALRHAMTLHPHSQWLWYLASTALIMNTEQALHTHVLEPPRLEALMIVDKPVVPPDSVIKTFAHLRGERVDFVLTQDTEGLAGDSLLLKSGDWAKYLLDAWYDPLYRSYNFQKAEGHALEHLVQWHGTVLARLALIPQRAMNSYATGWPRGGGAASDGMYQEGDLVANFHGCQHDPRRNCEDEMAPLLSKWRELRDPARR